MTNIYTTIPFYVYKVVIMAQGITILVLTVDLKTIYGFTISLVLNAFMR